MKTLLLTALIGTSLGNTALATVNMKDASFSKTWQDSENMHRTYDSRSLHRGIFGFGWCSEYEKNLNLQDPQRITLEDCSQSSEQALPVHRVKDRYFLISQNQKMIFNQDGKLILWVDQQDRLAQLTYDESGLLRKIVINKKKILHLDYDLLTRQVREIREARTKSSYQYRGQDLVQVRNAWKSIYHFHYDEVHNLTAVFYPDHTQEIMTYDADQDRILSYQSRKGCSEEYSYEQKGLHLVSLMSRRCGMGPRVQARFEFWQRLNLQGLPSVEKMKITQGTEVTEVLFDALSGEAQEVSRHLPTRVAASQEEL